MTEQEVFDKVWHHILTQGVPSADEGGKCLYRGPNGTMCAAGIFLTDEQAKKADAMEGGILWSSLSYTIDGIKDYPHLLIEVLQDCHDGAANRATRYGKDFTQEFTERAVKVAKAFNLTVPSVGSLP